MRERSEDEAAEYFERIAEARAARRDPDADAADAVYRQADRTVDAADRLWFARAGRQR
jgi:hypothetical protein